MVNTFEVTVANSGGLCYGSLPITGLVLIHHKKEVVCDEIQLQVRGKMQLYNSEGNLTREERTYVVNSSCLPRRPEGRYTFPADTTVKIPYSFVLPAQGVLPTNLYGDSFVVYKIEAYLMLGAKVIAESYFRISLDPLVDAEVAPWNVPYTTQHELLHSVCGCFGGGSVKVDLSLERSGFNQNSPLQVALSVTNMSSRAIKSLKVRFMQDKTYKCSGRTRTRSNEWGMNEHNIDLPSGKSADFKFNYEDLFSYGDPTINAPQMSIAHKLKFKFKFDGFMGGSEKIVLPIVYGNGSARQIAICKALTDPSVALKKCLPDLIPHDGQNPEEVTPDEILRLQLAKYR